MNGKSNKKLIITNDLINMRSCPCREDEGELEAPVDAVEENEDEREDGDAHEIQQLEFPLQKLRLQV